MTKDQQREIAKVCGEVVRTWPNQTKAFQALKAWGILHEELQPLEYHEEVDRYINAFTIPGLPPRETNEDNVAPWNVIYSGLKGDGLVY